MAATDPPAENITALIGADEWRSLQETMYLITIAGLLESVVEGLAQSVDDCGTGIDW